MKTVDKRIYTRLIPPKYLSAYAKGVWIRTLGAMPPEAFSIADEPVLVAYCQEFELLQRMVVEQEEQPIMIVSGNGVVAINPLSNAIAKHNASLVALASKLRLCPQARISTKTAQSAPEFAGEKVTDKDDTSALFYAS